MNLRPGRLLGGGVNTIAHTLAVADFRAPLRTSLVPTRGTGAPTFTRATTATVIDNEGVMRQVLAGEARFSGARRVYNQVMLSSEDLSIASYTKTSCTVTADQVANPITGVVGADLLVLAAHGVEAVRAARYDLLHTVVVHCLYVHARQSLEQVFVARAARWVTRTGRVRAHHGPVDTGMVEELGHGARDLLGAVVVLGDRLRPLPFYRATLDGGLWRANYALERTRHVEGATVWWFRAAGRAPRPPTSP